MHALIAVLAPVAAVVIVCCVVAAKAREARSIAPATDQDIEKMAREMRIKSGSDPDEMALDYGGPICNFPVERWQPVARRLSQKSAGQP